MARSGAITGEVCTRPFIVVSPSLSVDNPYLGPYLGGIVQKRIQRTTEENGDRLSTHDLRLLLCTPYSMTEVNVHHHAECGVAYAPPAFRKGCKVHRREGTCIPHLSYPEPISTLRALKHALELKAEIPRVHWQPHVHLRLSLWHISHNTLRCPPSIHLRTLPLNAIGPPPPHSSPSSRPMATS